MYCTIDDIKQQIPEEVIVQLTDDDNQGVIDEAKVNDAIANADALIDGYCSGRYVVPFVVAPAIIKPLAMDLAIYNLYARRVETMPDVRDKNRSNAIKLLADISKGAVKLGEVAATTPVQPQQSPEITSADRLFSRTSMKGL
jgi:phage gp36-like protein